MGKNNLRAELLTEETKQYVNNGNIILCDELLRISDEIDKLTIKEILTRAGQSSGLKPLNDSRNC